MHLAIREVETPSKGMTDSSNNNVVYLASMNKATASGDSLSLAMWCRS